MKLNKSFLLESNVSTMSPITRVTNATFDETFNERITPDNFENSTAIQTIILLFISIVLFFTLPKKMLAMQKRLIEGIFRRETSISSEARCEQDVEQTLVPTSDNAPSIQTISL